MSLAHIDHEEARMSVAQEAVPSWKVATRRAALLRSRRSATKTWIAEPDDAGSRERCAEVLLDPPEHVEAMAIFDVLRAVRRFGPERARQLCELAGARENREVVALSLRQRALIAAELRGVRDMDLEELVA